MNQNDDPVSNSSSNPYLMQVLQEGLSDPSRRVWLKRGAGMAAIPFMGGTAAVLSACGSDDPGATRPTALGFTAVQKSLTDNLVVATGYTANVLFKLGDPMAAGTSAYANNGTDSAASFATRAGDHHDGMQYFGLSADGKYSTTASQRGLLVMNHEAITPAFLHPNGPTSTGSGTAQVRTVADEVLREFYVHGVSVIEIERAASGAWSVKQNSSFNRRVHTLTETILSGPAGGNAAMVTKYSTNGTRTRGTVNNCANGYTPWGTYLTCEENWNGYFRRTTAVDNPKRSAKEVTSLARYAVAGTGRELWATVTPDTPDNLYGRWNAEVIGAAAADDYRNGPNTYGWVVEIDPFAPASIPKKRTALGRFAHEGAWPARVEAGKPLVWYSGDDSRGEYVYKYVSAANWDPADASLGMAGGDKYLDNGKLYVAKFNADGTGAWLELAFGAGPLTAANTTYAYASQADVLINSRLAADALGATKMDRPEWGAVDLVTGAVYLTLTNNNATIRTLASTDAANPRHYNDRRTTGTSQFGNANGHIIRWLESGNNPSATTFKWDIFLFGARAGTDPVNVNLSGLTADNDFSSPDGLWFSPATNICWIQTDDGAYTDVTNCMLLAALPGTVGDGGATAKTITNTDSTGATKQVQTWVGAPLGDKVRRFLVGPIDCEITGIAETPDGKSMFVNIQHPGEDTPAASIGTPSAYRSHWPDGGLTRPRSATIVITKNDGGAIGL